MKRPSNALGARIVGQLPSVRCRYVAQTATLAASDGAWLTSKSQSILSTYGSIMTEQNSTTRRITTLDCIEWLNQLDEGATIWDTDLKFINRIKDILEQYDDEVQAANEAYRKWKGNRDAG